MYAKQLQSFLAEETAKTDLSWRAPDDIHLRFEALRGCALIPRGKVRNTKEFSLREIVAAVLSLSTAKPGFAGFGALGLIKLQPVGGLEASFERSPTFGAAIEAVLSSTQARATLVEVRFTQSEVYTNAHGRASITYLSDGQQKTAYYVGELAVSLSQPHADQAYNPADLISSVVIDTVLYPQFFRGLLREMERTLPPPLPDPTQEEEEKRKEERARRLGLKPSSRFLNLGVDTQVTWPPEETVVEFDGHKLILLPKTKQNTTSIHIDLSSQRISDLEATTLINRFLSMLAWCDDNYSVLQDGWSGNPVPVPVQKRDLAFTTAYNWIFDRNSPKSPDAQKAIAIYRDGRNAEQNYLVSYAVLSYYKIIELRYRGSAQARTWFRDNYASVRDAGASDKEIAAFEKARSTDTPHDYLYRACRSAVAHANKPYSTDPDDSRELRRLHIAASILRPLARHFIQHELGVSDCPYDGS
jgi:hypothetical protein